MSEINKIEKVEEENFEEKVAKKGSSLAKKGSSLAKKVRAKRPLSAYNIFVKENMGHADVVCLPSKERMKKISAMWKEHKISM